MAVSFFAMVGVWLCLAVLVSPTSSMRQTSKDLVEANNTIQTNGGPWFPDHAFQHHAYPCNPWSNHGGKRCWCTWYTMGNNQCGDEAEGQDRWKAPSMGQALPIHRVEALYKGHEFDTCAPKLERTGMNEWYKEKGRDARASDCEWLCNHGESEASWCKHWHFQTIDGGTCTLYDCVPDLEKPQWCENMRVGLDIKIACR